VTGEPTSEDFESLLEHAEQVEAVRRRQAREGIFSLVFTILFLGALCLGASFIAGWWVHLLVRLFEAGWN
jgi:hypothetical protein